MVNRRSFLKAAAAASAAAGVQAFHIAYAPSSRAADAPDLGGVRAATVRWMGRVRDGVNLRDMSIPGTHESCALSSGASAGFAQCQERDLDWQLRAGMRYLDIRCRPHDGDSFTIHHGPFYQQRVFGSVLQECQKFLQAHPSETLLMRVHEEYSSDKEAFKRIFRKYLDERHWRSLFHISDTFPSLGDVRGKIVLMSGWPWLGEGLTLSDDKAFDIQDMYENPGADAKKKAVAEKLDKAVADSTPRSKMYLNHISANGAVKLTWTPWAYARYLNPYTLDLLNDRYSPTARCGIIAFDYGDAPGGKADAGDIDLTAAVIRMNDFKQPSLGAGKSYVIWNRATGKALDAGTDQTPVVQWNYDGLPQQRWRLEAAGGADLYRLRSERHSTYLTCRTGGSAFHTSSRPSIWKIISASHGFLLREQDSGGYLHMPHAARKSGSHPALDTNTQYDQYQWMFDERVQVQ